MDKKYFQIIFSKEQLKVLEDRALSAGFRRKSDYIRFILFMDLSLAEKINQIYKKIVENG